MQTSYRNQPDVGLEGYFADSYARLHSRVESLQSEESTVDFGRVQFAGASEDTCRTPGAHKATLACSGPLGASNVLAGNVVINGVTYAYTETYATSSAATFTALKNELVALAGGNKVTGVVSGNSIILTATPGNTVYFASGGVTGGDAVTVTRTNTDDGTFEGFALYQEEERDADGNAQYRTIDGKKPMINVVKGRIWVRSKDALSKGATPYVQLVDGSGAAEKRGMLASAAGAGDVPAVACSAIRVVKGCGAGGLALVEPA